MKKTLSRQIIPFSLLFLVSLATYGFGGSLGFFSDDWNDIVHHFVFGQMHAVNWADRRPFLLAVFSALSSIFGLQFQYYYLVNGLTLFLSAVVLYCIIQRLFPAWDWLSLPVSLVYLVYPVDFTRFWLMQLYIRVVWLIALYVLLLLIDFAFNGGKWKYGLILIGILLPLGAYEGPLGIMMSAPFLLAIFGHNIPRKRRLALLAILLIGVFFVIWRLIIQPQVLNIHDSYLEAAQIPVSAILLRFIHALQAFTIDWPILISQYLGIRIRYFLFVTGGASVVGMAAAYLAGLIKADHRQELLSWEQKIPLFKACVRMLAIGVFFWLAGYVPIISVLDPTVIDIESRVNLFSIAGAALLLVAGLACFALLIAKSLRQVRWMTLAALIPLVLVSITIQVCAKNEKQAAWDEQKQIWNGVFETLPNLKDGTTVLIIIPGYEKLGPLQHRPFVSWWEVNSALEVLYNNPTLNARFYYRDIRYPKWWFNPDGALEIGVEKSIPYSKLILVYADPQTGSFHLVKHIEDQIPLSIQINDYDPGKNIIPLAPQTSLYRSLVK